MSKKWVIVVICVVVLVVTGIFWGAGAWIWQGLLALHGKR
jgi:hypothetical protein